MKKLLCALPLALSLTACVTPNGTPTAGMSNATSMGVTIFKTAVVEQCQVGIESRPEWKLVSAALSADQKQQYESQVCGCVGDQAVQQVNIVTITEVAMDPNARRNVIANAITNSLGACVSQLKSGK